jgi:hypothetical protein
MPETHGYVTITNVEKTETFALNGVVRSVADAIAKFTGGAAFEGVVKIGGREVRDMEQELRDGDVVFLLNPTVAAGGVKGA